MHTRLVTMDRAEMLMYQANKKIKEIKRGWKWRTWKYRTWKCKIETSSEAANVWGWIDWVACQACSCSDSRNVEDQSRMGLIHRLEHYNKFSGSKWLASVLLFVIYLLGITSYLCSIDEKPDYIVCIIFIDVYWEMNSNLRFFCININ